VLLLPAVVIAGFMGMNEKTPFSQDDPRVFWIVVALIIVLALGTLIVLRLRRWL
jgi:Mg2+ and Co2+ transporter CorA